MTKHIYGIIFHIHDFANIDSIVHDIFVDFYFIIFEN